MRSYWPGGPQAAWPEGGWLGQPGRVAWRQARAARLVMIAILVATLTLQQELVQTFNFDRNNWPSNPSKILGNKAGMTFHLRLQTFGCEHRQEGF